MPADQADLMRLCPGSLGGELVLVRFAGPAAGRWRAGARRVVGHSLSWPAPWRPWQRWPVLVVEQLDEALDVISAV